MLKQFHVAVSQLSEESKKRMDEEVSIRLVCEVDCNSILFVSSIDY